ncbi:hypothetical protein [Streptomyces ardesiacus]|uniref:hypothetical protein n=1 Tax=Streptomyces ardesiacus TaxID=285564 RepID=UPI0036F0EE5A
MLTAYAAVRVGHCRRCIPPAFARGELWHLDGDQRLRRNAVVRERDAHDYGFTDWMCGPTALSPTRNPARFTPVPPASARL